MKSGATQRLGWSLLILVFLLLPHLAAHADRTPDEWFIDPAGENGGVIRSTTETELIQRYGAKNVTHDEMGIGEGQTEPATFLYIGDPHRSIAISWKDKDQHARPDRIQIDGHASKWHTFGNVTLGTSLKESEKLNGGPFLLSGFEWDYSGTVTSWNKGKLEEIFGHGRVCLRLNPVGKIADSSVDYTTLLGEGDFSSANPSMQKLNPQVYEITWGFQ